MSRKISEEERELFKDHWNTYAIKKEELKKEMENKIKDASPEEIISIKKEYNKARTKAYNCLFYVHTQTGKETARRYKAKNKVEIAVKAKLYEAENKEKLRDYRKAYRENNKEKEEPKIKNQIRRNKMYILIKELGDTRIVKSVVKANCLGAIRVFLDDISTGFVIEFNEKTIANFDIFKKTLEFIGGVEFTDKLDFFTSRALILLNEEFEVENKKEIEEWNPSVLIEG